MTLHTAILFDTETTALIENSARQLRDQPHVIELFALTLDMDSGEELGTFHSFFAHSKDLPKDTVRITGITNEMIKDAPPFADKAKEIKTLIEKHECCVAHNLDYDMSVLNYEFQRLPQTQVLPIIWPPRKICTVESTEHLKGYRLSLTALHELLFGEAFESAHRAEGDVRALARCFKELIKRGEI